VRRRNSSRPVAHTHAGLSRRRCAVSACLTTFGSFWGVLVTITVTRAVTCVVAHVWDVLGPASSRWLLHEPATGETNSQFDHLWSHELLYAPSVGSQVWIGAVTTLLGVALGGAASFTLSRQQMKDARAQRAEEAARERDKRSEDRRIQAYSDFLTRARSFRNAVMSYCYRPEGKLTVDTLDDLMRDADEASALVFLVVETHEVSDACRAMLRAIGDALNRVQNIGSRPSKDLWQELRVILGPALRDFQIEAREELGVTGSVIQRWPEYPNRPDIN
jgi:hypothetical protein